MAGTTPEIPTGDPTKLSTRANMPPANQATPEVTTPLTTPSIDRSVEQSLAQISGTDEKLANLAVTELKSRNNETAVALALAEIMMTSPNERVRNRAEKALSGTLDPVGKMLLEVQQTIKKLDEQVLSYKWEKTKDLTSKLLEFQEHPLVNARLSAIATGGTLMAHVVANAQHSNTEQALLESLRISLSKALDAGPSGFVKCQQLWQVPRILMDSPDAKSEALVIRAFKEAASFGFPDLSYTAASALGKIDTPDVHKLIVENVFSQNPEWKIRAGIAEAIKELQSESVNEQLLPLINGSVRKTAWLLAAKNSTSLSEKCLKWTKLMWSQQEFVNDTRVQVCLGLKDEYPALAAKVLNQALGGLRDPFVQNLSFFAAVDAIAALEDMRTVARLSV